MNTQINHKAVWLSVLAQQLLGFLWHSPFLFGTVWMKLLKTDPANLKLSAYPFVIAVFASIFLGYTLDWFIQKQNLKSFFQVCKPAILLWFAFGFLSTATNYAFIGIHWGVLLIDSGIALLNLLVTILILLLWKS